MDGVYFNRGREEIQKAGEIGAENLSSIKNIPIKGFTWAEKSEKVLEKAAGSW